MPPIQKTYAIDKRILEGSLDEFYPAHVFADDDPDLVTARIRFFVENGLVTVFEENSKSYIPANLLSKHQLINNYQITLGHTDKTIDYLNKYIWGSENDNP